MRWLKTNHAWQKKNRFIISSIVLCCTENLCFLLTCFIDCFHEPCMVLLFAVTACMSLFYFRWSVSFDVFSIINEINAAKNVHSFGCNCVYTWYFVYRMNIEFDKHLRATLHYREYWMNSTCIDFNMHINICVAI